MKSSMDTYGTSGGVPSLCNNANCNPTLFVHIRRSNNGSRPNRRLFTYIEGDPECMEVDSSHSLTTTSHETVTVPVQLASVVRKRYRSTKR